MSVNQRISISFLLLKAVWLRQFRRISSSPLKSFGVFFLGSIILFATVKILITYFARDQLSLGLVGVYSKEELPQSVTNLFSEPLIKLNKSSLPEPNLAKGWRVDNEGRVYTLTLKDNLYWSDGSQVDASEIILFLADVEVKVADKRTVEFHLPEPFSPFPTLLTTPIFKKGTTLVGVGKYRLVSQEQNQSVVTRLILKDPKNMLPAVVIRFYPDEKTLKTAYERGEIQSMVGYVQASEYLNQKINRVKKLALYHKIVAIFYNFKDPLLGGRNSNLRLALSYGAPTIEDEEKALGPFPSSSWAFNPQARVIKENLETAKSYLAKSEFDKGKTIYLTVTPSLSQVGEKVVAAWKKLGINAVVRVETGIPQNFQALLISEPIPQDPDQYGLWHSTQERTNIAKYSFARVDRDLEEGRRFLDKEKRKEFYHDFQKEILDDSPATFLYFPKFNIIYRKKIESDLNKVLSLMFPNV